MAPDARDILKEGHINRGKNQKVAPGEGDE